MNKRTEKAIKKWLALNNDRRIGFVIDQVVQLYEIVGKWPASEQVEIARFTLASVIKKRYPAKRKKGAK